MRAFGTGMAALLGSLVFAAAALAQPAGWQPSLDVARQQAAQSNRLVMIFFHNDACVYCKLMQRDVFSQKAVMDALQPNYTLVQVNADKLPAVAIQYGVVKLPTTVLTTPDGQMLDKVEGRRDAQQLLAQANQAAAKRPAMVAQTPTAPPTSVPTPYMPPPPPVAAAGPQIYTPPTVTAPPTAPPAAGVYTPPAAPALAAMTPPATPTPAVAPAATPVSSTPPGPPVVSNAALSGAPAAAAVPVSVAPPALPPGNPPLCLDGFCPVQLTETQRWMPGDRRFGLVHRGRTYLFAGQEERDRFNADPDKYAPAMSGNDIVLAVEQGQNVAGRREHGVFFGQRIYLFSGEASLDRFSKNPAYYADQALQALRTGAARPMYR